MSTHDTVVVGGGVTGLVAAWRLTEAGQDVVVLEARDRVGGRLRSEEHDGSLFEIGGQWVSRDQDALVGLLDELGLETYARYRTDASVYVASDGAARRFTGENLPVGEDTAAAIDQLLGGGCAGPSQPDSTRPTTTSRSRRPGASISG